MSVVLLSSDVFAAQKLASGSVHGCTLPDRLFSKKLTVKGFSEPTRTSVVPYRSEFACKLVAQECTRTDISERWHPCSPLLMILSFLVTSVIVHIKEEKRYA